MPTGGKLVGAILFAVLAWFVTDLIKPLLPEGTPTGLFGPINAVIGFLMGWTVMGKGAGVAYRQSLGYGLTTVGAVLFWALLLWSGKEVYRRSVRLYYDGPMDALQDLFVHAFDYLKLIAVQDVIVAMIVGGLIGGLVTEFFARRWS